MVYQRMDPSRTLGAVEAHLPASDWSVIASRVDVLKSISNITGIDEYFLLFSGSQGITPSLSRASIAEMMSWASKRQTTRKEDMAYCLLGIFDTNIICR